MTLVFLFGTEDESPSDVRSRPHPQSMSPHCSINGNLYYLNTEIDRVQNDHRISFIRSGSNLLLCFSMIPSERSITVHDTKFIQGI